MKPPSIPASFNDRLVELDLVGLRIHDLRSFPVRAHPAPPVFRAQKENLLRVLSCKGVRAALSDGSTYLTVHFTPSETAVEQKKRNNCCDFEKQRKQNTFYQVLEHLNLVELLLRHDAIRPGTWGP